MAREVKVYSTKTCPHCVRLKEYLNDNKIEFEDIDVSEDQEKAREMVDLTGQMGVPVIVIDGEAIVGFDRAKIQKALNIG